MNCKPLVTIRQLIACALGLMSIAPLLSVQAAPVASLISCTTGSTGGCTTTPESITTQTVN